MKITDKQNEKKELNFNDLEAGCVYIDVYNGAYIIATDDDTNVNLDNGYVYRKAGYSDGAVFLPVEAHLEIR